MPGNTSDCSCRALGPRPDNCTRKYIGVDPLDGWFGAVVIFTCNGCRRQWLHYEVEYEAFTASGRWFLGLLPSEHEDVTAQNAVAILDGMAWHVRGGGYYDGKVERATGGIQGGLMGSTRADYLR